MKTKAIASLTVAALVSAMTTVSAAEQKPSTVVKAVDAVFVRPISLASTVAGGVVFVLSLPVTAIRKEIKPAANELVVKPAQKTFKRPLGDLDAMAD